MSTSSSPFSGFAIDSAGLAKSAINSIRIGLGISGVLMLVIGIWMTFAPKSAITVFTWLLAFYLIIAGLIYLGMGIFARGISGGARALDLVLGVLFIVGSIVVFMNLQSSAVALAAFIGILVGILWIVEGIVSLATAGDAASKGWSIFFGILGILAGLVLLFSPIWGFTFLFIFTGISLIVFGIFQIVRAFTFGRGATTV
ncbi:HdeD family acid-resistance protein [Agromyces seonyuensis]|uniref:HdeD family acid-resistance protein n=1 Tax=Agromyces seonyuensis TaxID=2662446 RepID=A0A6I4P3C0_9MICO|nr:DUF308 domain-containing protein [Agromyces seonyuensis]MWB97817.1 hypothetical protein [Agromyces seonyuensis]